MDVFNIYEIPRRHFCHGDICQSRGAIYCRRCDLFVDMDHEHWLLTDDAINRKQYRASLKTMRELQKLPDWRWSERWFRPRNAPNIFKEVSWL